MKKKYICIIITILIIFMLILLFKNLIMKSYILNKVKQASVSDSFTKECYLDNDLQIIEYVNNDIALYEHYDEDGIKISLALENFTTHTIYDFDINNNITEIRDLEGIENLEDKETAFNQNINYCEDIKSGKITSFKFNKIGDVKYLVFQNQIDYEDYSSYEIFVLNLDNNFIEKCIMITEDKSNYTSIVRDYITYNEDNSSKIDTYLNIIEGL